MNPSLKLKIALLATCLVTASMNAITANIPEMAASFPQIPLYIIELITTIPSLFQMLFVLAGRFVSQRVGYKKTVLLGLLLCGTGGVIPFFIQNFYLLLITRCIFGVGCGLIASTLLTLIVYFYRGNERSTMIGLQGSVGGLGSAVAVFISGRLLGFGWQYSFAVYFIAFLVFAIFLFNVPNVTNVKEEKNQGEKTESHSSTVSLLGYALLMFVSVLFATLFVIKASTLVTTNGYGTSEDGSLALTVLSLGSLAAGAMYGKIRAKAGKKSLALFYGICAIGFILAALFNTMIAMIPAAFLVGYGYLAFVPYIQEEVSHQFADRGEKATSLILVAQSFGAFAAPYLGSGLALINENLNTQFLIVAGAYGLLAAIAMILVKSKKQKKVLMDNKEQFHLSARERQASF